MDFVTHLPWTSRGHDTVWVIMDQLTKLIHFLAIWMTFTMEEFSRLYIWEMSGYMEMEYQYLLYRIGIPSLWLIFGRVSREPWRHS